MRELPSLERIRELFDYDPAAGILTNKGGAEAGCISKGGYRVVRINRVQFLVHRIVWLHHYGRPPAEQLDHINCNRADNRALNLREATPTQNAANKQLNKNNGHGTKGVTWNKGRWMAQIKYGYRNHYLGRFDTAEQAAAAYGAKAKEIFGDFARSVP